MQVYDPIICHTKLLTLKENFIELIHDNNLLANRQENVLIADQTKTDIHIKAINLRPCTYVANTRNKRQINYYNKLIGNYVIQTLYFI